MPSFAPNSAKTAISVRLGPTDYEFKKVRTSVDFPWSTLKCYGLLRRQIPLASTGNFYFQKGPELVELTATACDHSRVAITHSGKHQLSCEVTYCRKVQNNGGNGPCNSAESAGHGSAYSLAWTLRQPRTKTLPFFIGKIWLGRERPRTLQLRNRSNKTNAAVESRMGSCPESGWRILPIPRSPTHVYFSARRVAGFRLNGYGTGGTRLPRHNRKI